MGDRKVYVNLKVRLVIGVDEGVEISDIINEMDYDFTSESRDDCSILDTEILYYEIVDSK